MEKDEDEQAQKSVSLANIYRAKYALAEVRNIDDVIKIHDMAAAALTWAKARGANEAAQLAVEIKLRSERKAGQILAEMKEQDLLAKNQYESAGNTLLPAKSTLKDLGVEKIESQRWQKIADIPEEKFEDKIVKAKKLFPVSKYTCFELNPQDPAFFAVNPANCTVTHVLFPVVMPCLLFANWA